MLDTETNLMQVRIAKGPQTQKTCVSTEESTRIDSHLESTGTALWGNENSEGAYIFYSISRVHNSLGNKFWLEELDLCVFMLTFK